MIDRQPLIRMTCIGFLAIIPLCAVLILAGVIAYWGFGVNRVGGNFIVLHEIAPLAERRLAGALAASVPSFFSLVALWHLFFMFRGYNRTSHVAMDTIRNLRAFSIFSALTAISAFLLSGVMRWSMGIFDHAALWTHLGFSISHAIVLFAATIVYVATFLIEQGYRDSKELREFV